VQELQVVGRCVLLGGQNLDGVAKVEHGQLCERLGTEGGAMTRRWYHSLADTGLLLFVLLTLPVWIVLCIVCALSIKGDDWE